MIERFIARSFQRHEALKASIAALQGLPVRVTGADFGRPAAKHDEVPHLRLHVSVCRTGITDMDVAEYHAVAIWAWPDRAEIDLTVGASIVRGAVERHLASASA